MRITMLIKPTSDEKGTAGRIAYVNSLDVAMLVSVISDKAESDEVGEFVEGRTYVDDKIDSSCFVAHLTQLIRAFCMGNKKVTPDEILDMLNEDVNTNLLIPKPE